MKDNTVFDRIEEKRDTPTLQEKLAQRKYKTPSKLITWAYNLIGSTVLLPKYNPHIEVDPSASDLKTPCIVVWNHLSRLDHLYTMKAVFPKAYNMVAGYSEFFRSHLQTVFKLNQIIPKKIYEADIPGIRAMSSVLRKGGIVTFSPEGMSSIYGTNQPVVPGSGRFIKFFGVHVYFLDMAGQYLTSTKHYLEERKGRTEARLSLLYTPEQLAEATGEEVEAKLNEIFRHDEFEWTRERGIKWNMHGRSCEMLDTICYRCPRCGADLSMRASGDRIECTKCGNGAVMNDYYAFEPFDSDCVIPVSPSKWVEEERVAVIREIRADPEYSFSEDVSVGYIPRYHLLTKKKTSEPCGSGKMVFDHSGVSFTGKIAGEDYSFTVSWQNIYSLVIMTDTSKFAIYVDGEFLEFTPAGRSVGKCLLITEEMHRLHANVWKNFPWNEWMYEE